MWLTIVGIARAAIPFLFKVPRPVWYGLIGLFVVGWYTHNIKEKVRAEKDAEFNHKAQVEVDRQTAVIKGAVLREASRAEEAQKKVQELEVKLDKATDELEKSKDANLVCIPEPIARQLRRQQLQSGDSSKPTRSRP